MAAEPSPASLVKRPRAIPYLADDRRVLPIKPPATAAGRSFGTKADLKIIGKNTPSYLRTKALRDLHFNLPDETIKTLEYLQNEYKLEDKYTMYLMVAALLDAGRYNDASIQISLIKAILNDPDADFLTAIQLIQELKIPSAKQFLNQPYLDSLIDFKLVGFDEYLESL